MARVYWLLFVLNKTSCQLVSEGCPQLVWTGPCGVAVHAYRFGVPPLWPGPNHNTQHTCQYHTPDDATINATHCQALESRSITLPAGQGQVTLIFIHSCTHTTSIDSGQYVL
jgi:hypothetical protein